jgi:hypothetical protein
MSNTENCPEQHILDLLRNLRDNKFTGSLKLQIIFNQGGVRKLCKIFEEEVYLKPKR